MEQEVYRPTFVPVIVIDGALYAVIVGIVALLMHAFGFSGILFYAGLTLVAIIGGVVFVLSVGRAVWLWLTERYSVAGAEVLIKRGLFVVTSGRVPVNNIAEVKAVMPVWFRPFGVGSVLIYTNDGNAHTLYNIKDPKSFVEKVKPEVVFRPSAG